jgi:molybdenum-dependent DNA-binding transcriptional regulator ModE
MAFHALPADVRQRELSRVMIESAKEFSHKEVARRYIEIYEDMLERPLVETESGEFIKSIAEGQSRTGLDM